jgi:hypothetical protein
MWSANWSWNSCGIWHFCSWLALFVWIKLILINLILVPKQYGGICKSNADCTVMSELGFFCNNGTCGCSNSSYYSSYECSMKLKKIKINMLITFIYLLKAAKNSYLSKCSNSSLCNDLAGLSCQSSLCQCSVPSTWDSLSKTCSSLDF